MGKPLDAGTEPGGHGNSGHLAVVIAITLPHAPTLAGGSWLASPLSPTTSWSTSVNAPRGRLPPIA